VVAHDKAARELGYTTRSVRESLGEMLAFYRERRAVARYSPSQ